MEDFLSLAPEIKYTHCRNISRRVTPFRPPVATTSFRALCLADVTPFAFHLSPHIVSGVVPREIVEYTNNMISLISQPSSRLQHLLCLLLFLRRWPVTYANSEGSGIACLDATSSLCTLECPNNSTRSWTTTNSNGVQSPCCPAGMDLVHPPTYNTDYHVTIKNAGSSISSLSYKPCEIVQISINVDKKAMKYLGLLIYFEDSSGTQIGEFIMPSEHAIDGDTNGPKFHTCGDKNTAVMHVNANTKHYHHTFRYQAPKANTGTLTLRVLVKHGITNGGNFVGY